MNCSGWKLTGEELSEWWLFHHKFHMVEFPRMVFVRVPCIGLLFIRLPKFSLVRPNIE